MAKRVKAAGPCSECGELLVDSVGRPKPAGTKTCSPKCRQKRARRIKRAQVAAGAQSKYDVEHQGMAAAVREQVADVTHEVLKEELRPLVREAMTEDVLLNISTLIGLSPKAIAKLEEQMDSEDETISQRAVTLLLKYTMGNPSVAPPPSVQAPAPMSVVFNIPRPGDTTAESSDAVTLQPGEADELRECTDCHEEKPDHEFVASSDRCVECFNELRGKVDERFAKETPGA